MPDMTTRVPQLEKNWQHLQETCPFACFPLIPNELRPSVSDSYISHIQFDYFFIDTMFFFNFTKRMISDGNNNQNDVCDKVIPRKFHVVEII
jgi:hypothetical protein